MVDLKLELPEGFLEEEVRCGYTVTREMKEIWAVELDLLSALLEVCRANGIRVMAIGGTLLGAVRHGGYIPWDDDIDVAVPHPDYEKLCALAPKAFRAPYFFQTEETDPGSIRGHAQLRNSQTTGILERERGKGLSFNQGIFIDIFPLDPLPEYDDRGKERLRRLKKTFTNARRFDGLTVSYRRKGGHGAKAAVKGILHGACTLVRRCANGNPFYRRYLKKVSRFGREDSGKAGLAKISMETGRFIWDSELFAELEEIPFEMLSIPVPVRSDEILTKSYGNWHEFVVGSSRHGGVFFDTAAPYTKYL